MTDSEQPKYFVWATFDSPDAALAAGKELRTWDKKSEEVRFGDIGVAYLTEKGKPKVKRFDAPTAGTGALTGILLGGVAALLTPVGLIAAATLGGLTGELVDLFHQKGLGLTDEQKSQIKSSLEAGKGLLVMLVEEYQVTPAVTRLAELGGAVQSAHADTANFAQSKELEKIDLEGE
jgi:uncharacterized membrane protein